MDKGLSADELLAAAAKIIDAHAADADGEVYMFPHPERPAEIAQKRGGEADAEAYWESFVRLFDLAKGPLYRITVFETDKSLYLFIDFHHIMFDGSSLNIFMRDLDAALRGETLSDETYTIFDLAGAEREIIANGGEQRARAYYDNLMRGCTGCTVPDGDRAETVEFCGETDIPRPELRAEDVRKFCEANGVTENAFFLAAMGFVLQRFTAAEDVSFTTIREDPGGQSRRRHRQRLRPDGGDGQLYRQEARKW